MPRKDWYLVAFIGWMVFITFASLYSFEPSRTPRFKIPHLDKVVHFGFYFVAALLGLFAVNERSRNTGITGKIVVIMGISLFVFGIIIEVLQHAYTTTRMGDIFDVLANGFGACVGLYAFKTVFSPKKGLN